MDPSIAETISAMLVILFFLVSGGGIIWILYTEFVEHRIEAYKWQKHEARMAKEKAKMERYEEMETIWHAVHKIEAEKYGQRLLAKKV